MSSRKKIAKMHISTSLTMGCVLLQAGAFRKLQSGDTCDVVEKLLSPKVDDCSHCCFCNNTSLIMCSELSQAGAFKKLQNGDISDIVAKLLSPKVDIQAPVFFDNAGGPDSLISGGCAPLFPLYYCSRVC